MYTYYIHYMDKKEEHARIFIANNIADKAGLLGLLLKYRQEVEDLPNKELVELRIKDAVNVKLLGWFAERREKAAVTIDNLSEGVDTIVDTLNPLLSMLSVCDEHKRMLIESLQSDKQQMKDMIKEYHDTDVYPFADSAGSVVPPPGEGE